MQEFWLAVLVIALAYLVGSVPFAYVVGRLRKGVDMRRTGTGNVGAYNVYRQFGAPFALLVTALDVGKGVLAAKVVELLGLPIGALFLAGGAVVAGHNWPIFLGFRGGTGVATSLGAAGAFAPLQTLAAGGAGLVVGLPMKSPPIGTVAGLFTLNLIVALTRPAEYAGVVALLSVLVIAAHLLKKYRQVRAGFKPASWREVL